MFFRQILIWGLHLEKLLKKILNDDFKESFEIDQKNVNLYLDLFDDDLRTPDKYANLDINKHFDFHNKKKKKKKIKWKILWNLLIQKLKDENEEEEDSNNNDCSESDDYYSDDEIEDPWNIIKNFRWRRHVCNHAFWRKRHWYW